MVNTEFTPTGSKTTKQQIGFGLWFVTNRLLLRRIGIMTLAVIDGLMILFVIYGLLNYYLISRPVVQAMYTDLTTPALDFTYVNQISQPLPLETGTVKSIQGREGKVDLVAEILNPNPLWNVERMTYHFESGDFVSESQTDYIQPTQTKYLINLGVPAEGSLSNLRLVIDDMQWKKVAGFEVLQSDIVDVQIIDPRYIPPSATGLSEEVQISSVTFDVYNNGAYNFWNVDLKVLLYRGSTLVGVNDIPLQSLDAGQLETVAYNIFGVQSAPSRVEVIPDFNILEPATFKAFEGVGEFK